MVHGILNVYKEKGYTSHDVVAKLRGIVGQKKIGHTGTLDPDAEGVLPVCLGKATKLCEFLTEKEKTYEAVLLLGRTTDTQDVSGHTLTLKETGDLSEEAVIQAVLSFIGTYPQIPPMYSAVKVGGKKLYELAREGKTIERKPRMVTIRQIRILKMELPKVRMEVTCSKGTYIRTLCADIGETLRCGGCMESLLRTRSGIFTMENSLTLQEIEKKKEDGTLEKDILPIDQVFRQYPAVYVKRSREKAARNGGELLASDVKGVPEISGQTGNERNYVRLYDEEGHFIALYEFQEPEKSFSIVKMFFPERDG